GAAEGAAPPARARARAGRRHDPDRRRGARRPPRDGPRRLSDRRALGPPPRAADERLRYAPEARAARPRPDPARPERVTLARLGLPAPGAPAGDALAVPHLRRNLVTLGADLGLFLVGLSFGSQSTVLPAFVASLGAPNVVVGAIPAVMTAGWFLPSLFVAGHTQALPRKLPFVLRYTIWERLPLLGLAFVAFFLAARAPA